MAQQQERRNLKKRNLIIKAFQATLVDFGFTSLTAEQTETAIRAAVAGNVEHGIISRFIHRWLEDEFADLKFADLKPECERLFKEGGR